MNYSQVTDDTIAVERADTRAIDNATAVYPIWPTSKPGPLRTLPSAHERPINRLRSEQLVEVGYNQEAGESVLRGE